MSSRSAAAAAASAPDKCRSPAAGLEEERCCSCCLDLANRRRLDWSCWRSPRRRGICGGGGGSGGEESDESPAGSPGLVGNNLTVDGPGRFLLCQEQEPTVRRPDPLRPRQGLRDRAVDQTLLSILLFFHSASGASVVAIDNKIEQAMDLVKNHLMYAVREEVEVLKEQIKELAEKNSQLEWENSLLKNMASPEQLQKFQSRLPVEDEPPSPVATTAPEKPPSGSLGAAAPAQHPLGSAV